MRLALSARDCARLGCSAEIEIDLSTLTNREAIALQQLGFASMKGLGRRLASVSEDGEPDDYFAWTTLVWLALRRDGKDVDVQTLEYDVAGMRLLRDEEPEPLPERPDSGKARGRAASTSSRRTSSTRTRTSKRSSTPTG